MNSSKRFRVALSFPGEYRAFVEEVASYLARDLGRDCVLYDQFYEAEFARPDLDTYLQSLYHEESDLIAVFLCAEYDHKEWCGLEWRAVRDLIKRRQASTVMPLRFDETEIASLFSIDGYVWIGDRDPEAVARLILERLSSNALSVPGNAPAARPALVTRPASARAPYNPPMTISVHGIFTAASWQELLADTLSFHGIKHRAYDFGHYGLLRFASDSSRQGKINQFYDFYDNIVREHGAGIDPANYRTRPSIIAHGLGTYIVCYAMQKYPDIRFDKLILCGSTL